jgi:pyruvate/2-oxoglutarate dehydrogenase complex dihydrolipoamide acyltransferase (E2) component
MNPDIPSFEIEARNKFFEANRRIVEYEIRPGNTVSFASLVDLTEIEAIRAGCGDRKPSYTAFVAKAVALSLRQHPHANRRVCRPWYLLGGTRLQKFSNCDIGIACERDVPGSEGTAFVDILRDGDRTSLHEMTKWLHALATCDVNTNKQWSDFSTVVRRLPQWLSTRLIRLPYYSPQAWVKYRGASALISSPAKYGVDSVIGTWSWPLGISFGLVAKRPVVREDRVVPCQTFMLTLNFDRRVLAGAQAARFFNTMIHTIEHATTEMAPYYNSAQT